MTDWHRLAETVVVEILEDQHSVTAREIEARAANEFWRTAGSSIDPDILTTARRQLEKTGHVVSTTAKTRGGAPVTTYALADQTGVRTKVDKAAQRKRLLTATHHSWSRGTERYPKGLIGQAGEDALYQTLDASDGISHIDTDVGSVLSTKIDAGTFDAVAYLTIGRPQGPQALTLVSEMKNQRQWFYNDDPNLHHFLYKAASLQVQNPQAAIVPVFVSARRQHRSWMLGRTLGFFAVQYRAQYVLDRAEVQPDVLASVAYELGYNDLIRGTSPNTHLKRALGESLSKNAVNVSEKWRTVAPRTLEYHGIIRKSKDSSVRRATTQTIIGLFEEPPDYEPLPRTRL